MNKRIKTVIFNKKNAISRKNPLLNITYSLLYIRFLLVVGIQHMNTLLFCKQLIHFTFQHTIPSFFSLSYYTWIMWVEYSNNLLNFQKIYIRFFLYISLTSIFNKSLVKTRRYKRCILCKKNPRQNHSATGSSFCDMYQQRFYVN